MNYFRQTYDPMQAMGAGMSLWGGMGQAYDAQSARAQRERERQALAQLGQGDLLLGFEDNPNAIRPDAVKALYNSGNPELALKGEALAAQPYLLDREMARQRAMMGMEEERALRMLPHEIERAKQLKQAEMATKMAAWKEMLPSMMGGGARPANALARPSSLEGSAIPSQGVSGGGPQEEFGKLDQALMGTGLDNLTGGSYETEFDLNRGPVMKYKGTSPLEDEKIRRELRLKGEDTYLNQAKHREELRKNEVAELNKAHERIFTLSQARKDLAQRQATGDIDPASAAQEMADLNAELAQAKAYRDELAGGKQPVTRQPAPAAPVPHAPPAAPAPRPKATGQKPAQGIGAGLPYKMQQELQGKASAKKVELAQGAIESAHADASKFAMHMPTMQNLMNLLATKDIGNRLGQVPGGETALRMMSADNDNLQKWRNEMIDVLKKEGQSQLMNTLPELAIVSDMFPSVTNSPDTNRKAMVNVMNLAEATQAAPQFLENWAAEHGGTLDGARSMFREWMQKNPRYSAETQNGKVSMYENDPIPLEAWTKLRKRFTAPDILKKREAGKIQVLNGRVFFQE